MKRLTTTLAGVMLGTLLLSGCNSGPRRLSRNWDEYVNQKYSEDSRIHGLVLQDLLPVYPIVGFFMAIGDAIAVNPYYFWSEDIWDGRGTAYNYESPEGAERSVSGWKDEGSTTPMGGN